MGIGAQVLGVRSGALGTRSTGAKSSGHKPEHRSPEPGPELLARN